MIEVRFRDQDGNESTLLDHRKWLLNDVESLAEVIAEEDFKDSGGDISDPAQWPRNYEIELNGKWVKVSVDMDYDPSFRASVNKEGERRR